MNKTDLMILVSFCKIREQRSINEVSGVTTKEINSTTNCSFSKISISLRKLISLGYIDRGISIKQTKTYYITEKGLDLIEKIAEVVNE